MGWVEEAGLLLLLWMVYLTGLGSLPFSFIYIIMQFSSFDYMVTALDPAQYITIS